MTIGGRGDHLGGVIHLGADRSDADLHGSIYFDGRDRHHRSGRHHGRRRFYGSAYGGFYYRDYSPIYGYGLGYHLYPYHGYRYASIYYTDPYLYRFADSDVYYVDQIVENQTVYDGPPAPYADPAPDPGSGVGPGAPPQADQYHSLIDPQDSTLIGKGNGAYLSGQYDEARKYYATAMLADERDGYAKFLYALANFAMRDFEVGGIALRRSLLTTPELIEYPVDIRGLYPDPVTLDAQMATLVRFVDEHPANLDAAMLLGYLLYAKGQPDRALIVLERVADADLTDDMAALLRDAVVRVSRDHKPAE